MLGVNVILDFGFWAKEERDDYRSRAREPGAGSEVIYTDVDDEEWMKRVRIRNQNLTDEIHHISEEKMKAWIDFFQRPDKDELVPWDV